MRVKREKGNIALSPHLEAEKCRGHAQDVDPAAVLKGEYDIALAHSAQLPLEVALQPPRQPRVAE